MSRTRYIKPGFFENERLAECTPLARILFAGLWCWADREGRLEERPKRIKAQILPYDDCNIIDLLAELQRRGFIRRYEVDGERYLFIPQFATHQKPHRHEPTSKLPQPTDGVTSTAIVGTEPDIVRSDYDGLSMVKPHGEWGMGNGEWGSRTQTPPSEFDHPVWGDGAKSDDDDPVFRGISEILELVGHVHQERGLIDLLVEYSDEPNQLGEAKRWLVKYGGVYPLPGQRLGSLASWYFVEREKRKNPKAVFGAQRASSTTTSSTTEYVRYDTPIKTDIPQAAAMFQAIKETGTCPMKAWEELLQLKPTVREDGTLVLLASDERTKQKIERLHRYRIDMACRESHVQFEIGVGA